MQASLVGVLFLGSVVGLYVLQDQKKTSHFRSEVLGLSLSEMAKQANLSALSRTKSLLQVANSGERAIRIQGQEFRATSGSGYQIVQGNLILTSPDPRSQSWMATARPHDLKVNSRVSIEKVEWDASLTPKAVIAVAETTLTSGSLTKSQKTRGRIEVGRFGPGPVDNPIPIPVPTTVIVQNPPATGLCQLSTVAGHSSASSQTGNSSAHSTAQGEMTGASAQTTDHSASACSQSQTGNNTATATASGRGDHVVVNNSTSTTATSASAQTSVVASGAGSSSASISTSVSSGRSN